MKIEVQRKRVNRGEMSRESLRPGAGKEKELVEEREVERALGLEPKKKKS